ncbi:MAG TPA: hypothetical protein VK927_04470 [Adhaeribacter sp.]|nr:hypothetical protein [Adhaeribacter sp.]
MLQPDPRRQPEKETGYQKFVKIFTLLMSLVYPALGIFIFFSSQEQVNLDPTIKKILGVILVIYGGLRFYRTYQRHQQQKNRLRDKE